METLDYLIALGTHPPMDDAAKGRLLDTKVVDGIAGSSRIFNHRWESPETFSTLGVIGSDEVAKVTGGKLEIDINNTKIKPGSYTFYLQGTAAKYKFTTV